MQANIGGTKPDLAIYSHLIGPHAPLAQDRGHSADYPSLEAMVNIFPRKVRCRWTLPHSYVRRTVINGREDHQSAMGAGRTTMAKGLEPERIPSHKRFLEAVARAGQLCARK